MAETEDPAAVQAEIAFWLIGPARQHGTPEGIVGGLAERLVDAGIPLRRVRIGQSVANPLISAWGVIWTSGGGAERYTVPRGMLATDSYRGSPFEHVVVTRTSFHHSLEQLVEGRDHPVLFELAAGSTDYLALPIEYGDESVQVGAFTTDRPGGFSEREVALIEALAPAIAAALEPAAMRHSMASLLEVYLGAGPADRIGKGAFRRGQTTEIEAAVLVTDLRDFTGLSERLPPGDLLESLGSYFEVVVDAVRSEGGDVLKFVGDGVLSVFSAEEHGREEACMRAARSITQAFGQPAVSNRPFVAAMHVGPVVYGNIGSLDRLDFTVVGPTVNYLSRLESAAKLLDKKAVCSKEVASILPASMVRDLGRHTLKGFAGPQAVFELKAVER
ncbi:adenylate/guanylate cyclase domain-containing protein [Mesorhizobium camelthorni]|uniref:Adenylate/guanylate cyclase domain-containing protein n=1 Tax=Allomesorhizobium camelthorni TaxID=475069 RepID=A0A6G4WIB0_9HYPH|nr:adenylate/guanylate cyclase domain-containing protein [Mesorhizobium camelthorni]NGO54344.1 adenylate/guanylate cyclase domain-containing protein [Mesorhizobium camelthorni]